MGNLPCPAADMAQVVTLAQDFCPFPDYNPSPHLLNMLSINSSVHLEDHYKAVQSSLSPTQLEDFTKRLRTTFGREGKVTNGGFGVVALSLAVLFDTLARKVKGECVSDQEPIPRLFVEDLSGSYPPPIYTVSKFLRMVPRIANNPARMRQETERYLRQLMTEKEVYQEQVKHQAYKDDITLLNLYRLSIFAESASGYLSSLTNGAVHVQNIEYVFNDNTTTLNVNCQPEVASVAFMEELQKSDQRTQEAFKTCNPQAANPDLSVLESIATIIYQHVFFSPVSKLGDTFPEVHKQREDFDLKAHALGKWA